MVVKRMWMRGIYPLPSTESFFCRWYKGTYRFRICSLSCINKYQCPIVYYNCFKNRIGITYKVIPLKFEIVF